MCTIIFSYKATPGHTLLIGDNRDERYDRPAAPGEWWARGADASRIWAPRDLRAGGTWIGTNDAGVFAGLTNRFGSRSTPTMRSRGELVIDALKHSDARGAALALLEHPIEQFAGFHIFIADSSSAHVIWHAGDHLEHEELSPGVHILTERSFGAAQTEREVWLRQQLDDIGASALDFPTLRRLLGSQRDAGFDDVKVHLPEIDYGTRSSTLISLPTGSSTFTHEHVDGGY